MLKYISRTLSAFLFFQFIWITKASTQELPESGFLIVDTIAIAGAKLTKPQVIFRELLFKKKDTIPLEKIHQVLQKSKDNLMNTSLFNFVYIDTIKHPPPTCRYRLQIRVIERWPVIPDFTFKFMDRNFMAWWETKKISRLSASTDIIHYNFRGRRENLILGISIGFNERLGLTYLIPYINKKRTLGIGFSLSFNGSRQVIYNTFHDKPLYFMNEKRYLKKSWNSYFQIVYRPEFFNTHAFRFSYDSQSYLDTLNKLNPHYGPGNDGDCSYKYFSFSYQFRSDKRNNRFYPLKGHYFDLDLEKKGIFPGDEINYFSLHSTLKFFCNIYRFVYWGSELSGRYCPQYDHSYSSRKALGYEHDMVRGYEYYVIDGQNFVLFKSNLKLEILNPHILHLKFIRSEKFNLVHYALYLNLFADMGYVNDAWAGPDNSLPGSYLFGTGVGLDFITYYDKIIRVEYSFNKLKESGIFVSFITAI